jgi:small conductance mechanosensitive channel
MDFKELAEQYLSVAWDWLGDNAGKIVLAFAILVVGRWLAKAATGLVVRVMNKRDVDVTLTKFLTSIFYYTLLILVFIAAAGQLGIDTMSFVTILGAAGLAVGLALKDSLSNFASGVMLIVFKPFKVGDFVEVGGKMGAVEAISIFNTVMTSPDNKLVIVPNAEVTGGVITNFTAKETRRVDLVFGIGYGDDIKRAKEVLEGLLAADPRVLEEPAPKVAVSELGDSSVNFVVRPWVKTADYWDVFWDLTEKVKLAFDAEGISIPFPQRDVHLYKD